MLCLYLYEIIRHLSDAKGKMPRLTADAIELPHFLKWRSSVYRNSGSGTHTRREENIHNARLSNRDVNSEPVFAAV